MTMDIAETVRSYVRREHFSDGDAPLTDQTSLVTSGLLSSIQLLQLVSFLEQTFNVEISSTDLPSLDTVESIVRLLHARAK